MYYQKQLSVDKEALASPDHTFGSLFELPGYSEIWGAFFQLAEFDRRHDRVLFNIDGSFNDKNSAAPLGFIEAKIKTLLNNPVLLKRIPWFEQQPAKKDLLLNNLRQILPYLNLCPKLLSETGRLAFWLYNDIPNNIDTFFKGSDIDKKALLDFMKNGFSPDNITHVTQGGNNRIYKLTLPLANNGSFQMLIALRLPETRNPDGTEKPEVKFRNAYSKQFEIHTQIYQEMETIGKSIPNIARIPKPFFLGGTESYIAMQFIDHPRNICEVLNHPQITEEQKIKLKECIINTLNFWKTGNDGAPLFIHRDLDKIDNVLITVNTSNEITGIYFIDFDLSIYKPSKEQAEIKNGKYAQVIEGCYSCDAATFAADSEFLKFLVP